MTGVFSPAVKVEVASVVQTYPSQTFTLLNASGYVVPQRKSSVAAKATGRLVALYVEEGNKIKKDQIIAQLENDDLAASRRQALANLDVSRAGYEQAKAELNDAQVSFERQKQLLSRELVAKSDYDTAEARYKKAIAAVASADASIKASQAALERRRCIPRIYPYPRPLRCCCPYKKRRCRRYRDPSGGSREREISRCYHCRYDLPSG